MQKRRKEVRKRKAWLLYINISCKCCAVMNSSEQFPYSQYVPSQILVVGHSLGALWIETEQLQIKVTKYIKQKS